MVKVDLLSFQEALDQTENRKRHLLLGNGFSIALFPDIFRYGSLLEEADFTQYPQIRQAFDSLNTTDFEVVTQALNNAVTLSEIYGVEKTLSAQMQNHAHALKELLVQAIAGNHPERPSDISDKEYKTCRTFLAHFAGESRNQGTKKNWQGSIFSINYDLLLYWALMHDQEIDWSGIESLPSPLETPETIEHDDGFRTPDNDPDAPYVTWDGENSNSQSTFYLHGALHLFDHGYELQKKCWERSGGIPLIDQIRSSLSEGRFPLFVSEGNSRGKYMRIRHSDYLHKSLRSFRASCNTKNACLFIFGHSLAANDDHILKQIEKGKIGSIYISLYGLPTSKENEIIIRRAHRMAKSRPEHLPLEVCFFDSDSANIWGKN